MRHKMVSVSSFILNSSPIKFLKKYTRLFFDEEAYKLITKSNCCHDICKDIRLSGTRAIKKLLKLRELSLKKLTITNDTSDTKIKINSERNLLSELKEIYYSQNATINHRIKKRLKSMKKRRRFLENGGKLEIAEAPINSHKSNTHPTNSFKLLQASTAPNYRKELAYHNSISNKSLNQKYLDFKAHQACC
jgi:hypothetical protein